MQVPPGARVLGLTGQSLLWANRAPTFMLVSVIAFESVFVNVADWGALVAPTATLGKVNEVGENRIGPTVPSPDNATDCDKLGASSKIVTAFVLVPDAKGRNWIDTVQEAAAANVDGESGQVLALWMKSDPEGTEMLEIVRGPA